ncbi:Pre-mRNA-processing factor 39 [Hordeum vulgare]|nr:Pre-mRNA-processing factor 39 [Hordeum vulgare]
MGGLICVGARGAAPAWHPRRDDWTALPLVMREEDEEAEAVYQNGMTTVLHAREEEACLKEEEEATAYQSRIVEAMALSAAGDYVVPSLALPSLAKVEHGPLVLKPEQHVWDRVVREWVNVPPVWLDATLEQEVAYLEHYRH